MIIAWVTVIILVFLLIASAIILASRAKDVEKRGQILSEALLSRQHRIPLLLEVIGRSGKEAEERAALVDIREKVSSAAYTLEEQIMLEKRFSELLDSLFRHTREHTPLKSDALYHSLRKELELHLEEIRKAQNDYNYSVQKWNEYCRWPWFRIFAFAFKIRGNKPLQLL